MSDRSKAGRELDALIAEKVMGWTHVHLTAAGHTRGRNPKLKNVQTEGDRRRYMPQRDTGVPRFSTETGEAWKLVERLGEYFGFAKLEISDFSADDHPHWMAEVNGKGGAVAETPALAICLAALEAVAATTQEKP